MTTMCSLVIVAVLIAGSGVSRAAPADVLRKAEDVVIPELAFEQASVLEILGFLKAESKRLDPDHVGVNFFVRATPADMAMLRRGRVTLNLRNIAVEDIVDYLCKLNGLRYVHDENAIVISTPSQPASRMQTRIYPVQPGVLDSRRTRPSAADLEGDDDNDD